MSTKTGTPPRHLLALVGWCAWTAVLITIGGATLSVLAALLLSAILPRELGALALPIHAGGQAASFFVAAWLLGGLPGCRYAVLAGPLGFALFYVPLLLPNLAASEPGGTRALLIGSWLVTLSASAVGGWLADTTRPARDDAPEAQASARALPPATKAPPRAGKANRLRKPRPREQASGQK